MDAEQWIAWLSLVWPTSPDEGGFSAAYHECVATMALTRCAWVDDTVGEEMQSLAVQGDRRCYDGSGLPRFGSLFDIRRLKLCNSSAHVRSIVSGAAIRASVEAYSWGFTTDCATARLQGTMVLTHTARRKVVLCRHSSITRRQQYLLKCQLAVSLLPPPRTLL